MVEVNEFLLDGLSELLLYFYDVVILFVLFVIVYLEVVEWLRRDGNLIGVFEKI